MKTTTHKRAFKSCICANLTEELSFLALALTLASIFHWAAVALGIQTFQENTAQWVPHSSLTHMEGKKRETVVVNNMEEAYIFFFFWWKCYTFMPFIVWSDNRSMQDSCHWHENHAPFIRTTRMGNESLILKRECLKWSLSPYNSFFLRWIPISCDDICRFFSDIINTQSCFGTDISRETLDSFGKQSIQKQALKLSVWNI